MNKRRNAAGLTLIEIVFACAIFVIFMGIIASTFSSTLRSYFQGNAKIRLQNTLRTILDVISSDLRQCTDTTSVQITPGPTEGDKIRFEKSDARKRMNVIVEYVFNFDVGSITRNDYDADSKAHMSTAVIGENISSLTFYHDTNTRKVTIRIAGINPAYHNVGTIQLETAVQFRSGEELMTVRSIGSKEGSGASCLLVTSP